MTDLLPDAHLQQTETLPVELSPFPLPYGIKFKPRRRLLRVAGITTAALLVLGGVGIVMAQSMGVSPSAIIGRLSPMRLGGRSVATCSPPLLQTTDDSDTLIVAGRIHLSANDQPMSALALDVDNQS